MCRFLLFSAALACTLLCSGCQSTYYGAMERVGVHKRDIMEDRVKDARDSQAEAKASFQSALEQFSAVVEIHAKDLEKTYTKLNQSYEEAESRAAKVHQRIDSIESVSKALFKEWDKEIKTYASDSLKQQSRAQLKESQGRYDKMMASMNHAADQMSPVLVALRDQVLFLKHNLNSAAIASIQGEVIKIEADCSRLIQDMEKAIAEADAFIANWSSGEDL